MFKDKLFVSYFECDGGHIFIYPCYDPGVRINGYYKFYVDKYTWSNVIHYDTKCLEHSSNAGKVAYTLPKRWFAAMFLSKANEQKQAQPPTYK